MQSSAWWFESIPVLTAFLCWNVSNCTAFQQCRKSRGRCLGGERFQMGSGLCLESSIKNRARGEGRQQLSLLFERDLVTRSQRRPVERDVAMRRSRPRHRGLAALFVLSAVLVSPTAARVFHTDACEKPAPTLATLRRSEDVASNAEVVYQNCTVVKISSTSSNGTTTVDASNLNIQAVSSFPDVTTVMLSGNQVTTIYEDTDATVKTLYVVLTPLFK